MIWIKQPCFSLAQPRVAEPVRRLSCAHSTKVLRARIWWHRRHPGCRLSLRRNIYVFSAKPGRPDGVFNVVLRRRNRLGFVASCWVSKRQTEEHRIGRARAWHGRGMRLAWPDIGSSDCVLLRVCARYLVCHGDRGRNSHTFMYRRGGRNSSGHLEMTRNNPFERSRGRVLLLAHGARPAGRPKVVLHRGRVVGAPRRESMIGINQLRLAIARPRVAQPHRYAP